MEIPKGYKQTEVGVIPEDWDVKELGEICVKFRLGGNYANQNIPNENVLIKMGNIQRGCIDVSKIEYIKGIPDEQDKLSYGTLLLNTRNTPELVGKVAVWRNELPNAYYNSNLLNMICDADKYSTIYLNYAFNTEQSIKRIKELATGTTSVAAIYTRNLVKFKLPVPRNAEQHRIASAISEIDELITGISKQIEKKRQIKEGAMQQLLTGKTRLPGFSQPWREVQIGKIGYTYPGITGKSKDDFNCGDAMYITFLNVLNNPVIDTSIFERVNISPTEGQNAAHKGDLFFNTSSETPEEVGICAVLNEEIENLYLNSFCFGYRLTDETVLGHYLAYFWRSKQGREIMTSLAQGATRYNLSKAYFNKVILKIPQTKDEQSAIVDVLSTMDDEIHQLEAEQNKYALIKQGMMQELLTGKTRLL